MNKMASKTRYFQIVKWETKFSVIFRIRPASKSKVGPMGADLLDGFIQSDNEEQAATTMKTILNKALSEAGFKEKTE